MPEENETSLIAAETVQDWAEDCIARLRKFAADNPTDEVSRRFEAALREIKNVDVRKLDRRAFILSEGLFTLNAVPLSRVFQTVLEELSIDELELDPQEIIPLCRMIVAIFLLHEMRHIDQGVERFEAIQSLKELGFSPLIAELDLLADRDALVAFAAIFADDFGGDSLEAFATGLAFSPSYFFKAFDFDPKTKPHKTLRAVSLILMLARIYSARDAGVKANIDLTAALSFYGLEAIGETTPARFVIIAEQPSRRIYQIADEDWSNALAEIITAVEERDYGQALAFAMDIVKRREFENKVDQTYYNRR